MNTLLQWFVTSSVLILAVLALRRLLGGRISPRVKYALWAVVLVRLLVPFQLPTPHLPTAADLTPEPTSLTQTTIPLLPATYSMAEVEAGRAPNLYLNDQGQVHTANSAGTVKPSADGQRAVFSLVWLSPAQLLLGLWAMGAVILALVLLGSNLRFFLGLRRRRTPVDLADGPLPVYAVESLPSPCLFGLFRPCIYLTPDLALDSPTRAHVLAHELTHYRQKDHIWSALRCAALALHWYNPLVWLAVALSKRDGELSCDAGAVMVLGEEERIPYGRTLVSLVAQRSLRPGDLLSCSTSMAEGKGSIQERIAQLVKRPEAKKTALFAVVALAALAVVFTFGNSQRQQTDSTGPLYSSLRSQIQAAQSIRYTPSPISSTAYPDAISDADLLEEAKELLVGAYDLMTPVTDTNWEHEVFYAAAVTLITEREEFSYYICSFEGGDYLITPAQVDAEKYTPVGMFSQNAGAAEATLAGLAQQQSARNASTWRVEYPEFKSQLTQLFLGVEECVLLNQSEDYDMEEWLTQYTSFYEIIHGVPWWLEGAPEGWYARAMDAGSWYTIVIPDSMVSQVQAICEEQAQYPSFDTVYSALENTDTIQYAAMSAMSSRGIIRDPAVIDQITQLLLTPQGNTAQVSDPGRVTIGEEFGSLTIPLDEEHELFLCLQEVEGGCLLSCGRTDNTWSDTQPVLWTLPAGTAHKIYAIYEDWLGDLNQSAGASAYDWQDSLSFQDLEPGDETSHPAIFFAGDGTSFTYHITYAWTGLTLELGMRSLDGTKKYSQRVVGGDLEGTISDIPAGRYQVFVRNISGDDTTPPAILGPDGRSASGMLLFLRESLPSSASRPYDVDRLLPSSTQADATP